MRTLAGIMRANMGRIIKICRVLNMFHSCDMTPFSDKLTKKLKTKPAFRRVSVVKAALSRASFSF